MDFLCSKSDDFLNRFFALFSHQVSDFGLAKWLPDQWTHHTIDKIEGTFGFVYLKASRVSVWLIIKTIFSTFFLTLCLHQNSYLPPEFFMHGIVDEKTDVFAYGVLVLELITGRQALDGSQKSLVMWVCL